MSVDTIPVVEPKTVILGSLVTVLMNEQKRTFFICGHQDGDIAHERISYDSPLGRVLMGLEVEDEVTIRLGGKLVDGDYIDWSFQHLSITRRKHDSI